MSRATEDFCRQAVRVAPSLAPILDEHLEDNFDEMLPHVFFGDVSRWVSSEVARPGGSSEAANLLELLEASYPTAVEDVQNLINVSFVEMVQDDPAVVRLFGPTLLSRVDPGYQPRWTRGEPSRKWSTSDE